mgnify:CR=1 FL=1
MAGRSCEAGDGAFVVMVGRTVSNESGFSSDGVTGAVWFDGIWISTMCGLTTINDTTVAVISCDLLLEALDDDPPFSSSEYVSSKSSIESVSS